MGYLSVEFVKKNFALAMLVEDPLKTVERLMEFFTSRRIYVDSIHLQSVEDGQAKILIYCLIEKDRAAHTRNALERLKGILELQVLEHKEHHTVHP